MATSEPEEALTIESKRLASIAYHVVGVHTEGGPTPYTGAANAGGASGLSIGTMQHDFGQRPTTAPGYASAIVDWYTSTDRSVSFSAAQLATGILKKALTPEQRSATAEFGASAEGAKWIYDNLEKSHVDDAVQAAQKAFATSYGQAVLAQGTHVEEFAAYAMKIFNQYGGGPLKINGEVSDYKSPGFQGLLAYLDKGRVALRDNRSGHDGETIVVVANNLEQFDRDDLLAFSRGYASTRSNQSETNSPGLGDNRAIVSGPQSALNSGALYGAILDSDSPLTDILRRVETKGDFSPTLISTDPDVALARAMFGADTSRMKNAVSAINDATTLDPVSISTTLGQYPGTLWVDPLTGRIALSYKTSSNGFVVGSDGYAKFATSSVVKEDGIRTLQVGENDAAVSFDQIATPLINSRLPREPVAASPIGHWEEQVIYTDVGVALTTQMIWVSGPASRTDPLAPTPGPPTNHTTAGAIYLSRDGASATFPDGQVINAGLGGRLELGIDGNLSAMRPVGGYDLDEKVYSITLYGKGGQIIASTQVQLFSDSMNSGDPGRSTTLVQGQTRDVVQVRSDGSNSVIKTVFQTGFGWVEQDTGELVQSIADWKQERSAHTSAPPVVPTEAPAVVTQSEQPEQTHLDSDPDPNSADLTVPNLANQFTGALNTGAYGAGQLGGFDLLPLNDKSSFLVNADGDMVAEITRLPTGYRQLKGISGTVLYVSEQSGRSYTQDEYKQAQAGEAANAIGLMGSIIGLQHWANMSDLQRTAAVVSIYHAVDTITGGDKLPGDLGTAASVLGLLNALEKGNVGGMLVSGISLANSITNGATTKAIGEALGMPAGKVIPALSLLLALDSGDPLSIAAAAANFIPVYGQVISVALSVLGAVFGGDAPDIPMREGFAHAEWDAAGNVVVVTDQDVEGGGATAADWMNSLVNGLQGQLAGMRDAAGNAAYALVPGLLPAVGFQYDPDGFNLANGAKGFVYLKWTDGHGQAQTRYYDGAGSRGDGTGETLAGDFMRHAAGAIAPAWQVQTVLAHYQQGHSLVLPDAAAGLPQVLADGVRQAVQAVTLQLPDEVLPPETRNTLADIDNDGFLEPTQWLAARQQALAVDADGDGAIDASELLSFGGPASLHNMTWLDANNDRLLDARDPAFAALRVWVDADADARSQPGSDASGNGETQTLAEAGIVAIDFGSNPPTAVRADGSRTPLATQQLVGDVLGVQYRAVAGGVLQLDEQHSGPAVATLHAVNTRAFDGDAGHTHGGEPGVNSDGPAGDEAGAVNAVVGAGDERLVSTTAHTLATQGAQTRTTVAAGDARLRTATTAGAGSAAGLGAQVREAHEAKEAKEAMVRSAEAGSLTPLLALAVGAAVQWPTLASATTPPPATTQPDAEAAGWAVWSGSPASAAFNTAPGNTINAAFTDAANSANFGGAALASQAGTSSSTSSTFSSTSQASESYASNRPPALDGIGQVAIDLIANGFSGQATPSPTPGSAPAAFQPVSGYGNAAGAPPPGGEASQPPPQPTGPMATDVQLAPPQVRGEQAGTLEDTGVRFLESQLLVNDSTPYTPHTSYAPVGPNDPGLRITSVFAPVHGSVWLQANALGGTEVVFVPEADYNGPASFQYTVTDSYGLSSDASVSLNIGAVNDAPTVLGESATGDEDTALLFTPGSLLANDFDIDADIDNPQAGLRIVSVDNAVHGAVSLQDDGTIRFVPEADYFGPAQFTYTVGDGAGGFTVGLASLNIAPVNDAPQPADDAATLDEDTEARFTAAALLANDTDVDNAHSDLTITAVGNASHGSVQLVAGEIVFTPDVNFNGTASFSYTVSDVTGGGTGSGAGSESQATVTLTFNPVNDTPVTNDELLWGKRDVGYTLTQAALLANDMDAETPTGLLRISAVGNAQHGTAVLGADGSVRFTPEAGYAGRGSFDYLVQDPEGATSTATAQIDFSHTNITPLATDDGFTGYEDMAFNIAAAQLLVNDSDADNAAADLRVTAVAHAQNGTVALQADGSVRFVPAENFYGVASFQYRVSDGDGGHTWATARLNVHSVNDAPIIEDILYGRPIYGYQRTDGPVTGGGDGVGATQDMAVYSQAEALVLAGRHELFNRSLVMTSHDSEGYVAYAYSYTEVAPTYYRNGDMRPVATQALDAAFYSEENPLRHQYPGNTTRWAVDDLYRQGGNVVAYDPDGDSSAITFSIGSGPQHGHAWANQYTSLQADRWIDHTQAPAYAVAQTGAWQYYSQRGDPFIGADAFTMTVTDGDGASTQVAVNTAHVASSASGGGGGKPVTLDLDGNGLQYVGLDDSQAYFDLNHDGWRERLAWVGDGDALLARDIGGDGVIERADEISFVGYLAGARTDLEGLAAFDSNGNGLLDRLDARWREFGAWRDANGDGMNAPGEFRSLDDIGITQIGLQSDHQTRQFDGVTELGQSRFTWADGRTGAVGDVAFAADDMADGSSRLPALPPSTPAAPPAPPALTPEHAALLMLQVISTATAAWEAQRLGESGETQPVGYVMPPDADDARHALAATQAQWADAAQAQAAQMHGLAA